ncbi:DUF3037 domain-containing protein [Robertkochia solimangrovi]|uniref:DUF3037 domain-containing protein n=1 Tax=Robertkochia solimangrovi TaxID=2213046 RepID=UPI00117F569B|nr:DUF3037 domain-containing protein [Robertkochia solimangrovi]TRZ46238.1 DUF3037 domain-containing protein [Robertkochia solimangrovi]
MHGKHLYDYAVIRLVPKVEREEFINLGILMYCKQQKYLKVKYFIDPEKIRVFTTELELEELEKNLQSFQSIAEGKKEGGRVGTMDLAERFRWLTAVRSSCIQTSRPHSGFSDDLDATLERLFEDLVL